MYLFFVLSLILRASLSQDWCYLINCDANECVWTDADIWANCSGKYPENGGRAFIQQEGNYSVILNSSISGVSIFLGNLNNSNTDITLKMTGDLDLLIPEFSLKGNANLLIDIDGNVSSPNQIQVGKQNNVNIIQGTLNLTFINLGRISFENGSIEYYGDLINHADLVLSNSRLNTYYSNITNTGNSNLILRNSWITGNTSSLLINRLEIISPSENVFDINTEFSGNFSVPKDSSVTMLSPVYVEYQTTIEEGATLNINSNFNFRFWTNYGDMTWDGIQNYLIGNWLSNYGYCLIKNTGSINSVVDNDGGTFVIESDTSILSLINRGGNVSVVTNPYIMHFGIEKGAIIDGHGIGSINSASFYCNNGTLIGIELYVEKSIFIGQLIASSSDIYILDSLTSNNTSIELMSSSFIEIVASASLNGIISIKENDLTGCALINRGNITQHLNLENLSSFINYGNMISFTASETFIIFGNSSVFNFDYNPGGNNSISSVSGGSITLGGSLYVQIAEPSEFQDNFEVTFLTIDSNGVIQGNFSEIIIQNNAKMVECDDAQVYQVAQNFTIRMENCKRIGNYVILLVVLAASAGALIFIIFGLVVGRFYMKKREKKREENGEHQPLIGQ